MGQIIVFFIALICLGFVTGFAGFNFSKILHSESNIKKIIYYLLYISIMLGLAHTIGWIKMNVFVSETYKGIGTILMISSVIPGIWLAKKMRTRARRVSKRVGWVE